MYTIPEAAKELEVTEAYIRMMIREGVIETTMVPTREGSRVTKHTISDEELEAFAHREGKRAPRRRDGRSKCVFYATLEELDRVKELLYATHEDGLMTVAQTMTTTRGTTERWIPPSQRKENNG
jgi:excisionase family DNA binding protein